MKTYFLPKPFEADTLLDGKLVDESFDVETESTCCSIFDESKETLEFSTMSVKSFSTSDLLFEFSVLGQHEHK